MKNDFPDKIVKVALNLADDLQGGWTNRITTDFDSKFALNALVTRGFCAPYLWTSESNNKHLVFQRTKEYCYRTIYWQSNPKPVSLEDHVRQEIFVANRMKNRVERDSSQHEFYTKHKSSEEYSTIIHFLYGSAAAESLGFQMMTPNLNPFLAPTG